MKNPAAVALGRMGGGKQTSLQAETWAQNRNKRGAPPTYRFTADGGVEVRRVVHHHNGRPLTLWVRLEPPYPSGVRRFIKRQSVGREP